MSTNPTQKTLKQHVQEINSSIRKSEQTKHQTRYQVWWDAGLCGSASDEILYNTLPEAIRIAKSRSEEYGWTWDSDKLRTLEEDMCETPFVFIKTFEIPNLIYNLLTYAINLLEPLEELMTEAEVYDYNKYPTDAKIQASLSAEEIRRAFLLFHRWHYSENKHYDY